VFPEGWTRLAAIALLATAATVATVAGATGATGGVAVAAADTVDTPPRTVELDGQSFVVSGIGRTPPGEPLAVDVDAPADESYRVYLYDADRRIVSSGRGTGASEMELQTTGVDPGTYLLAVQRAGVTEAVQPLVVAGYDVRVREATVSGGEFRVTVAATRVADAERSHVAAVLAGPNGTTRANATPEGSSFVARLDVPPGSYRLYATVHGPARVRGSHEVVGVSDSYAVDVDAGDETVVVSPTPTTTASETPTRPADGATKTARPTRTPTPRGVITPAPTDTPTGSSSGVPGFGVATGVLAVAVVAAGIRVRRRTADRSRP
jgi:hypothetical protein